MNDHEIFSLLEKPLNEFIKKAECQNKTASKPGGQRVNKKATAVVLSIPKYNINVHSKEYRSREDNLKHAGRLLRLKLAISAAFFPKHSIIQKFECYFLNHLKINEKNSDLAFIFAIITGLFCHFKGNHKEAAETLKISNSCLSKFICKHKILHERINTIRKKYDICPIKD